MAFRSDSDRPFGTLEFEQGDGSAIHELRANGLGDEIRESVVAKRVILFDLDDIEKIAAALSLNRYDVVGALPVYADVYLIGFYLTDSGDGRPEMVLKRVSGEAGGEVYQSVVAQADEQRLLVFKRVHFNNAGRRIRDFCDG